VLANAGRAGQLLRVHAGEHADTVCSVIAAAPVPVQFRNVRRRDARDRVVYVQILKPQNSGSRRLRRGKKRRARIFAAVQRHRGHTHSLPVAIEKEAAQSLQGRCMQDRTDRTVEREDEIAYAVGRKIARCRFERVNARTFRHIVRPQHRSIKQSYALAKQSHYRLLQLYRAGLIGRRIVSRASDRPGGIKFIRSMKRKDWNDHDLEAYCCSKYSIIGRLKPASRNAAKSSRIDSAHVPPVSTVRLQYSRCTLPA